MFIVSLIAIFAHWWLPAQSIISLLFWGTAIGLLLRMVKNKLNNRPSLTATTFVVIILAILSSFAGLQPMASVKDKIVNSINSQVQTINVENKGLVGKWQKVTNNKVSILSPTITFLSNRTIIIDDGNQVLTGTYTILTDEYVKFSVDTSFFGIPITSMDTIKYQINNNELTIRVNQSTSTYKRIEE
jgi:predicted PurR-regulated permease PerM